MDSGLIVFEGVQILYEDNHLIVETENADRIAVIADGAVQLSVSDNRCTFDLANAKTYCRIEAHSEDDSIFSNPIMLG